MTEKMLCQKEAAQYLGIGLNTFKKMRNDPNMPDFPKPRRMGYQKIYWLESELEAYKVNQPTI